MPAALLNFLVFLAQTDGGAIDPNDPPPQPSSMPMIIMVVAMFFLMYLFILKPQKARENEEKQLHERLKKNDHVITKGGMYGVVMNVKDDEVVLKVDEQQNVKIRFRKDAIASIVGEEKDKPKEEAKPT